MLLEKKTRGSHSYADGHVCLRQTQYINRMAAEHLPQGASGDVRTPCDEKLAQHVADALIAPLSTDAALLRRYQSLVGALLYCATNTRPDVAYSVGMLCRAMARPTEMLMRDAQRVLGYLQATRDLGLRYSPRATRLYGMSDSDWAVKHSTSGYVFMLSHAAISWASKKQPSVALSSCEAELMAASEAAKEAVYLSNLARELGVLDDAPVELFMDNKSAIHTAYNPQHHGRMKHVERRHYFVRELVETHKLRVPFVSTVHNIADFFTKSLHADRFTSMRDTIMNVPGAAPTVASDHGGALRKGGSSKRKGPAPAPVKGC
jgi:hypothetical protein